jgi:ABC-type cobalamin/Fe3+-siderophores transport system ATPase subunit
MTKMSNTSPDLTSRPHELAGLIAGATIVMVLHDLHHATRCTHHVVSLRAGRLMVQGLVMAHPTDDGVALA